MAYRKFIAASLAVSVFAFATPASAQLLGGSGGLGGNLGGTLGGPIGTVTGTVEKTATASGETRADRRSGRVQSNGSASGNGTATGSTILPTGESAQGSGSGSAAGSGSLDAQLVGTDYVGSTAQGAIGTARGAAGTATGTAQGAVTGAKDRLGQTAMGLTGTASGAGALAGNAGGMFQGSLGQLVASGTGAANGAGTFAVEPGMPVTDPRGKVIGYVQQVSATKRGVIETVTVEAGNRVATLPAASFAGSGDLLVSGMTKGELGQIAKQQEATNEGQAAQPAPVTDPAPAAPAKAASGDSRVERGNVRED